MNLLSNQSVVIDLNSKGNMQKDNFFSSAQIICPIGKCNKCIQFNSLLNHIIRDHLNQTPAIPLRQVFKGKRATLSFNPHKINEEINCIGVLCYNSSNLSKRNSVEDGYSNLNQYLNTKYSHLKDDLIIMIMATKISFRKLMKKKDIAKNQTDDNCAEICIWLTSLPSSVPVYAVVTAFNDQKKSAKSSILRLCDLYKGRALLNPRSTGVCDLRLSYAQIPSLIGINDAIDIEISIHE